jgi:hypothetical protein
LTDSVEPLCAAGSAARLGTTGVDRNLIIAKCTADQLRAPPRLPPGTAGPATRAVRTRLDVRHAELSVVDQTPEELLLLQLRDIKLEYEFNMGAGARFTRAAVSVSHFQVRCCLQVKLRACFRFKYSMRVAYSLELPRVEA